MHSFQIEEVKHLASRYINQNASFASTYRSHITITIVNRGNLSTTLNSDWWRNANISPWIQMRHSVESGFHQSMAFKLWLCISNRSWIFLSFRSMWKKEDPLFVANIIVTRNELVSCLLIKNGTLPSKNRSTATKSITLTEKDSLRQAKWE